MRKTIFWVFGIVAVVVLLAKSSDIATLFETVSRGALIPIIAAAVFQLGKYVMQSVSLAAAFGAVGEDASWRRMVPLVFSGIFINTIAPTGGTASAVLVIDDARRRGISPGKATSAALVAQMGVYSGFIIIMIMGFIILQMTGRLDPTAFLGGMVLVVAVAFFAGILFVCRKNKEMLYSLLAPVERAGEKVFVKFRRPAPKPWAENLITSFSAASDSIATNPMVALSVLGFSTLASGLEMLGFVSVGFAFGLTAVNELIAAYVVTNIFTIVSPSPNGVGFAEAAATLVLTSYGTPATISTAIALVFRGFVFWVPFAVGALLLRRTGFFAKKKDETEEEKALQTGYLAGLFIFVFGLANVVFAIVPVMPSAYELLTTWFSVGNVFSGTWAVILGIMLILMTRGMIRRSRTTWAWAMVLLILLAVAQLMSAKTYYAALAILVLAAWLFRKRSSFDRLLVHESMRST
ncbi:MAG: flippase-like domain-containing protein, partial [Actinobacteria bacterium]|nr:flippase-like domain-containing protein [Actinomycetota bacterium]